MNPNAIPIKNYIEHLSEKEFRKILKNFLEQKCGYAEEWHSASEHGVDIIALNKKDHDFVKREITILVQAKKGKVSPRELRTNIFGQMSEMFVRDITNQPFHPYNPRRLLLIVNGELTTASRELVANWNNKMPLPIEYFELNEISELLYDAYGDVMEIIKTSLKKPTKKILETKNLQEVTVQGTEDVVSFVEGYS